MAHDIYGQFVDDTNELIASIESSMGKGGCKSYDEYTHLCGQIRGLRQAQQTFTDLAKASMEDDDHE